MTVTILPESLARTRRKFTFQRVGDGSAYLTIKGAPGEFLNINVEGLALRDALLEAFPLEDKKPKAAEPEGVRFKKGDRVRFKEDYMEASRGDEGVVTATRPGFSPRRDGGLIDVRLDSGVDISAAAYATRLEVAPTKPDRKRLDVVPGMVFRDKIRSTLRVTLPGGNYYNVERGKTYDGDLMEDPSQALAFDPRGATALPSPLGIRVGDTVRRVTQEKGGPKVTVEFEVNHISPGGSISTKYGPSYDPRDFEVVSREVPDRLPAGTITREKRGGALVLRKERGSVALTGDYPGYEAPEGVMEEDLGLGDYEVIYLP